MVHGMHILVTIDMNYIHPLRVMLCSLLASNPGESFDVHLMHAGLPKQDIMSVSNLLHSKGHRLHNHQIDDAMFVGAPVGFHFSRAMYYRLLAPALLPGDMDRILYLDPDLLILQPIAPLYQTDMSHCVVAAAKETIPVFEAFCRLHLKLPLHYRYFNSGVMLMNLDRMRATVTPAQISECMRENGRNLLFPDQDLLNLLFNGEVKYIDGDAWNCDARFYGLHRILAGNSRGSERISETTAILHFKGRWKPWRKGYAGMLKPLYMHYEALQRGRMP